MKSSLIVPVMDASQIENFSAAEQADQTNADQQTQAITSEETSTLMVNSAPQRNCCLVRSSRTIPLANDVVGVGWGEVNFSSHPNASTVIEEIKNAYGGIRRWSNQIWRFKSIRADDLVVVPWWGSMAIGRATGVELYDPTYYSQDGCNQQRVHFPKDANGKVKLVPRGSLSHALQNRLNIRITIANLNEFRTELEDILTKLEAGATPSWTENLFLQEDKMAKDMQAALLVNIRKGKNGLKAGGLGLERLILELLRNDDYTAQILGKQTFLGHGDADIKASKVDRLHTVDFLIQVKHHNGITDLHGQKQLLKIPELMPEYTEHQLVLVTSGDVGRDERNHALANGITIIDGPILAEWIYQTIPKLSLETKKALGISEVPRILV
jgi:restriction system protein